MVEGYRATTFDCDPPADADKHARGQGEVIAVFRASIPGLARCGGMHGGGRLGAARRFAASFDADLDRVASSDHASLFEGAPTV